MEEFEEEDANTITLRAETVLLAAGDLFHQALGTKLAEVDSPGRPRSVIRYILSIDWTWES